jgi:hypothetical protein
MHCLDAVRQVSAAVKRFNPSMMRVRRLTVVQVRIYRTRPAG